MLPNLGQRARFASCPSPEPGTPILKMNGTVIANGKPLQAELPASLEEFLRAQHLLPRSVVVEHNGEAVAPSEFAHRQVRAGDRLEIVRIVAGG